MWRTDRDKTKRLADSWNLRVQRGGAEFDDLDADLHDTVHRLEALWASESPTPEFVMHVREELRQRAVADDTRDLMGGRRSPESRFAASAAWPHWLPHLSGGQHMGMGQAARNAAMAVLLLLVLGLGAAAYTMRPSSPRQTTPPVSGMASQNRASASPPAGAASPPYALFAAASGKSYVRLDPNTLADLPQAAPLDFGERYPNWAHSADGAISARRESAGVIDIRSSLTGPVLRRIQTTANVFVDALSRDGTRLLTQEQMFCSPSGCSAPVWYVYDTTNGRLVSTLTGDDESFGGLAFLAPSGRRLYEPAVAPGGRAVGPWPLQIVAYDLTTATGREAGRLTLPSLPAGVWYDRVIDQVPVEESLMPAIALSPDGRTIAVVHADTEALTLIDATALRVERTMALTKPESRGQRLLGWLGLAPQTAAAKFMNGRSLDAVYAADGRTLYVSGIVGTVGATEADVSEHGLGLRAIDVATGAIVGQALGGQEVREVIPAPDGRAVYAVGSMLPGTAATAAPAVHLVRLDARSLAVLAMRDLPDLQAIILVPPAL